MKIFNVRGARKPIRADDLDIVSAIWMLACNDQGAITTYRGIADRLEMPGVDEDRVRELVKGRAELFSPVVASTWLTEWKNWIKNGAHYPRWVQQLAGGRPIWNATIDALTREDVFRSQFRTRGAPATSHPDDPPGAPPSTSDQVKLGLEHIDRLRKAGAEAREERTKLITGAAVPALAILLSTFIAWQSLVNSRQATLQTTAVAQWESTIRLWDLAARIRGDAYGSSFDAMQSAFDAARHLDDAKAQQQLALIRSNLYRLDPLIENEDARKQLWNGYEKFRALCFEILSKGQQASALDVAALAKKFDDLSSEMHARLYHLLFDKTEAELKALRTVQRLNVGS